MKKTNNPVIATTVKEISSESLQTVIVKTTPFSTAELWSMQRNRRVRAVRRIIFN